MSTALDLASAGAANLKQPYEEILKSGSDGSWVLYTYAGAGSNELRVQSEGTEGVDEMKEELSESRVQYGFVRLTDSNSGLPKFVLLGWVSGVVFRIANAVVVRRVGSRTAQGPIYVAPEPSGQDATGN